MADEEDIYIEDLVARGAYALRKEQENKKWWYERAFREMALRTADDGPTAVESFVQDHGATIDLVSGMASEIIEGYTTKGLEGVGEDILPGGVVGGVVSGRVEGGVKGLTARAGKDIKDTGIKAFVNIKEKRKIGKYLGILAGIGVGAALGAVIGTLVFPVIGTAIGGAIGAGIIAVSGVTAGVVLGVLGGWIGLKTSRAVTKRALKDSPEKYKIHKKIANELEQTSKLSAKDLTELHAYVRNRERSLDPESKERKALESIRKRAFKRGSKQGIEYMMYFLADEAKALDALSEPTQQQQADKLFIKGILGKLKEAKDIEPAARNHVRVEYAGEKATIEIKDSFKRDLKKSNTLDAISMLLTRKEKQRFANKEGVHELKGYRMAQEIKNIQSQLDELKHKDIPPKMISPDFEALNKLHESYGIKEKVLENILIGMQQKRKQLKKQVQDIEKSNQRREEKGKEPDAKALAKARQALDNAKRYERLAQLQLNATKLETAEQMAFIKAQQERTSSALNNAQLAALKAKKARARFIKEKRDINLPRKKPTKKKAQKVYQKQKKEIKEAKQCHKQAKKNMKSFKKGKKLYYQLKKERDSLRAAAEQNQQQVQTPNKQAQTKKKKRRKSRKK